MDYKHSLEDSLLNVLFIMLPLIFYQFTLHEKTKERKILTNLLKFFIFGLPMILCMLFPATLENDSSFDLRIIPLILGCLYGNFITSFKLLITLNSVRLIIDGFDTYLSVISSISMFMLVLPFFKKIQSFNFKNKLFFCVFLSLISKIIVTYSNYLQIPNYSMTYVLPFYLIHSILMAFTIYVIESITQSVQLRKEIIESEKMKVASIISASIAHEIRNPLTAVRGFLQLFNQTEFTPDKKRKYVTICLEEIDRAQQIINDYLSLAKPYTEIEEELDIGEEILYVCNILTSLANLTGTEIKMKYDINLFVLGDRQKLRQSIINIAKNGIEAMGDSHAVLKLEAYKRNNEVILSIGDTGIGMTIDQISRLGTPYFSTKDKGTGLGMMVSFSNIKSMMGKINVKSELGKGTVYDISFPLLKI